MMTRRIGQTVIALAALAVLAIGEIAEAKCPPPVNAAIGSPSPKAWLDIDRYAVAAGRWPWTSAALSIINYINQPATTVYQTTLAKKGCWDQISSAAACAAAAGEAYFGTTTPDITEAAVAELWGAFNWRRPYTSDDTLSYTWIGDNDDYFPYIGFDWVAREILANRPVMALVTTTDGTNQSYPMIIYGYEDYGIKYLWVWNPNNQTNKTYTYTQFFNNGNFVISGFFGGWERGDGTVCPVVYH